MNHDYRHRLEEATTCTVYTFEDIDGNRIIQLVDACGDSIAEFNFFAELFAYTIEAVQRFEALQEAAL